MTHRLHALILRLEDSLWGDALGAAALFALLFAGLWLTEALP